MIILDTNVISETQRHSPNPKVLMWLNAQSPSNLYLSTISLGELMFGVYCLPLGKRFEGLLASVTAVIEEDFRGRILPYYEAAARMFGQIVGAARRRGRAIGQVDGQIGAIALAHEGAIVANRDTAPFDAMGVAVVDPWA
jgi:toxin FitB